MPEVTIDRIANGGDGVGTLPDGRVVFVPRALPGDVIDVEVTKSKKRWAKGEIRSVLTPSPDRIPAQCGHFKQCGGCDFQHLQYTTEARVKFEAATEAFRRISKLECAAQLHPASHPDHYRIRARWHASEAGVGYYRSGTHDVFSLRECPVLHPKLLAFARALPDVLQGAKGEISAEMTDDEIVVTATGALDPTVARRISSIPRVRGVRLNRDEVGDPTISGMDAWGVETNARLDGGRFRQSNGPMTPVLRGLVRDRVGTTTHLIELFAGSGSFTHVLAEQCEVIDAFELDPRAVQAGNRVASQLGNAHITFSTENLEESVPSIPRDAAVLLDPPRTGAQQVSEVLSQSTASKIVYVSCDIGTLARDAKIICTAGRFELTSLDFVDMFPRTSHVEAIAVFTRSNHD